MEFISDAKQHNITLTAISLLQELSISITRPNAEQCSCNVLGAGSKQAILWVCAWPSVSRSLLRNLIIMACEWCCIASNAGAGLVAVGSHQCPGLCWTHVAADSAMWLVSDRADQGGAIAATVLSMPYPTCAEWITTSEKCMSVQSWTGSTKFGSRTRCDCYKGPSCNI